MGITSSTGLGADAHKLIVCVCVCYVIIVFLCICILGTNPSCKVIVTNIFLWALPEIN